MNRIDLFLLTQAFASPTDMASSGVKENIILATTPTLDGVCGMLLYINFEFNCLTKMDNNSDIVILPTFDVVVTDVIVTH